MEIRKQLDEIIKRDSNWKVVNNVLMYLWNEDAYDAIMLIFDKDPANFEEENQHGYYDKFITAIQNDVAHVWAMLDNEKQQRWVDLAMEKYG